MKRIALLAVVSLLAAGCVFTDTFTDGAGCQITVSLPTGELSSGEGTLSKPGTASTSTPGCTVEIVDRELFFDFALQGGGSGPGANSEAVLNLEEFSFFAVLSGGPGGICQETTYFHNGEPQPEWASDGPHTVPLDPCIYPTDVVGWYRVDDPGTGFSWSSELWDWCPPNANGYCEG